MGTYGNSREVRVERVIDELDLNGTSAFPPRCIRYKTSCKINCGGYGFISRRVTRGGKSLVESAMCDKYRTY